MKLIYAASKDTPALTQEQIKKLSDDITQAKIVEMKKDLDYK